MMHRGGFGIWNNKRKFCIKKVMLELCIVSGIFRCVKALIFYSVKGEMFKIILIAVSNAMEV